MANNRNTYQQQHTVSVKRENLLTIATDPDLSKKDLKVFLLLLTQLDGYSPPVNNTDFKDPLNFKRLDIDKMADLLDMNKKEIKKSIKNLEYGLYIEQGSNETIKNGWRFTF